MYMPLIPSRNYWIVREEIIMGNKRNSFSGAIGFVLAAAGSAVGLGNIWRFPYLAAKDGGGLFVIIYIILALTFGYTLLVTEVSIGRLTKQSSLTAYNRIKNGKVWKALGIISCLVPFLILPYYCIIGGWVTKYSVSFATNKMAEVAHNDFFGNFITDKTEPIVFDFIFLLITVMVVFAGVNKGIERMSKILMPSLLFLIIFIAIYALLSNDPDSGRSGLDGLKVYLIPDLKTLTFKKFVITLTDAMGQLFYSISVAMGIMIAYGSYFKKENNLVQSVNRIELFDTFVAFTAGIMIIPPVFVYMGYEGLESGGPGLMFKTLPKVFLEMGDVGKVFGAAFFVMVFFAALTSSVSVLEAVVSSLMDKFKMSRKKAVVIEFFITFILGVIVCLGYNVFYFEAKLPNSGKGQTAQILDIMDYLANNILMPIVAIGTCILIGWVVGPKLIIDEATINGEKFRRKKLYVVMIKYICPILLFVLLAVSLGLFNILGIN